MTTFDSIRGIGPAIRRGLEELGIADAAVLAGADVATLVKVRGISPARAESFIAQARALVTDANSVPDAAPRAKKDKKAAKGKTAKTSTGKKDKKAAKDKKVSAKKKGGKGKKKSKKKG